MAAVVFTACLEQNIVIEPKWIKRNKNEIADSVSRVVADTDSWEVS